MSTGERTLRGRAAIVGVADAASPTGELDLHGRALEAAVIREALADAGLSLADVDGLAYSGQVSSLAEFLAVHPRYVDGTGVGGSSYELHVEHAAAAIAAGLCEVVLGVYAATPRSDRRRRGTAGGFGAGPGPWAGPPPGGMAWELPYGLRAPMGAYALAASRHMALYGTTSEQLARIAVDTRRWAGLNPRARYRDPITVEDVLASPMQASPLHLLDCCLVTDGAGAFVMTSAERATGLAKPPVWVLGAASCGDHAQSMTQMPDLTTTAGAVSGPAAFAMAGVKPGDVDVLMGYDSFTITALLHLEDLGFCAKGEGGPFVEAGGLGPGGPALRHSSGGPLAMNTNGGGLSYTHPGMYGMFLLVEATRQLRGEAGARQIEGATVAVAHGSGGLLSTLGTVVLGTEAAR
jgi:acetyl-CoA acetyltransferase